MNDINGFLLEIQVATHNSFNIKMNSKNLNTTYTLISWIISY